MATVYQGTTGIAFDFVGCTGPIVAIADVTFYTVDKQSVDLLDVGSAAAKPVEIPTLPPGFRIVKEPE